jgi:large subunit ribosomal protein L24
MKFKKNDTVKIIAGKDKGKTGKIIQVFPEHNKVVVEGCNVSFRNVKPRKQNEKGQRLEYSAPIDASNVMLVDPKNSQTTRINYRYLENGDKIRISNKSKEVV